MKALRQHRLAAGMSISTVSRLAGVPRKTIARLERGDYRWATLMQLRRVAQALGLRVTVEAIPYFAQRKASKEFSKLDASGKTGKATDITQMISEDREATLNEFTRRIR